MTNRNVFVYLPVNRPPLEGWGLVTGGVNKNMRMEKNKVYIVVSQRGQYETYMTRIEKVFRNKKEAKKFLDKFEREHLVGLPKEEVYNIVPEDVFYEYDWAGTDYRGYTRKQFEAQSDRIDEAYGFFSFGKCVIEEFEVE